MIIAAFIVIAAVAWFTNHQEVGEITTTNTATTNNANTGTETNVNTIDETNTNSNTAATDDFTLVQEATSTTSGDITSYSFGEEKVFNVMPADMQSITVAETAIKKQEDITIGAVTGQRLTVSSAKDGSEITIVQVVRNGQLYDFRGSADFLDHLADYIAFN